VLHCSSIELFFLDKFSDNLSKKIINEENDIIRGKIAILKYKLDTIKISNKFVVDYYLTAIYLVKKQRLDLINVRIEK